jgi:hypothetical protein
MFIANFLPLILILSFQFIIGTNAKEFEAFPTNEFEPECLVNDETFNRNSLEKAIKINIKNENQISLGALGHC